MPHNVVESRADEERPAEEASMQIDFFRVEFKYKRRYRCWREKRLSRRWTTRVFLISTTDRNLALKMYREEASYRWYKKRRLINCDKLTGPDDCTTLIVGNMRCMVKANASIEELVAKVKSAARQILRNSVYLGSVKRPERCSRCGSVPPLEAHHSDYNKPLDVEWLCRPCHNVEHHGEVIKSV